MVKKIIDELLIEIFLTINSVWDFLLTRFFKRLENFKEESSWQSNIIY